MNELQAMHIKSIARHVLAHTEAITSAMQSIQSERIISYPAQVVVSNFDIVRNRAQEIERVLSDMVPQLPPDDSAPVIVNDTPSNVSLNMPPDEKNW